ncbi:hypothetical protein PISMIDRAFT_14707 [Pisolithus microcarpus 441]|uniref:Uncharacterized protein n=1 Tax=Pisolithus microcarpus 441 TaxID=765257 RepID=A0A0C9ZDG2_9AGAM|nr:hypothetical protein PISMIDRAFT_14707 [Pisolithus microcarpus 441]
MPRTSKHLLKAAARARAAMAHKWAGPKGTGSPVVAELLNSKDTSELHHGVTDEAEAALECDWDGSINHHGDMMEYSMTGSNDLELEVQELEGKELLQSLGLQIMNEQKLLTALTLYKRLWDGITPREWEKAEKNQHLGYNGLSKRTRQ